MMLRFRVASLIRRVRRRSWPDRAWLVLATGTAVAAWGALRLVPFQRLVQWTGTTHDRPISNEAPVIQRTVWAVQAVVPRLFAARPCLVQALATRFLLARQGVATHLRLGVAHDPDTGFRAHAWLERNERVLIGGDDAPVRYTPLSHPNSFFHS